MSRRDLVHVLTALAERSGGRPGRGVPVADVDEAIGRHRDDMRTPLNLADLAADGRAERLEDGTWALTPAGIEWIEQDRRFSGN
jgi:hypothetical protein